jgi:hypothetical protein
MSTKPGQPQSEQLKIEDEQRRIAHEQRMGQLKGEIAQLNELNSKLVSRPGDLQAKSLELLQD